jgi:hypothetical protein
MNQNTLDYALIGVAAVTGVAGSALDVVAPLYAQAAPELPAVSWAFVAFSLGTLSIREAFAYLNRRLEVERHRAENEVLRAQARAHAAIRPGVAP